MRIMTFNTQHCRNYLTGEIDFACMADAIIRCAPDIVGLNEMRGAGVDPEYTDQTSQLARLTGLSHFYFAKAIDVQGENPYGNALLSRIPILCAETIPIPDPSPRRFPDSCCYESRCLLRAVLANGLTVLVCHFGLNSDEQESAVRTILPFISSEKCVLMGDFNVTPESSVLAPIREIMQDAADRFPHPLLSFPSDRPDRKIDYVFVSRDIVLDAADIPALIASDHRPHTATLH